MGRGDHLNNDATFFTFRYVREGVFGRRIQSDTEEEDARREGLLLSVLQAHDQVLRLQHTRQGHQGKYSNNLYRLSGLSPVTYFSWPCSVLFRSFCGRGTARSTRSSPWGRPSSNLTALTWCISPLIGTNYFHREPPTSVPTNLSISGELRNSWRNPAISTGQGRPALIVGEMGDPHLWPPLGRVCFDLRRVIALAASAAVATLGACFRLSQNVWSTLIWSFDFPI